MILTYKIVNKHWFFTCGDNKPASNNVPKKYQPIHTSCTRYRMTDPGTPEDLSDNSPIFRPSANRLQMFVDNDWPQPVICNAETERADKKARRRISKSFFLNKCGPCL